MRTISIVDDIEQIALQLVQAVPDVFLEDKPPLCQELFLTKLPTPLLIYVDFASPIR